MKKQMKSEKSADGTLYPVESDMDGNIIRAAEAILAKGGRVELIPLKEGIKVVRIRRETMKTEQKSKK